MSSVLVVTREAVNRTDNELATVDLNNKSASGGGGGTCDNEWHGF